MDVRLTGHFTTRAPLSHIGEAISTTSYLVQEPILQPDGTLAEVFCYSGNAWRGQLRDLAASYLLRRLDNPTISLDVFHLLFSGGRIGGEQAVNIERARSYRRALPLVALWGGGVGNQILPGKLRVSNAYPVCREALPVLLHTPAEDALPIPYRGLTMEKSFSRKDDGKDDRLNGWLAGAQPALQQGTLLDAPEKPKKAEVADQMRMTAELLIAGVRLETRIDALEVSEVELGCLVSALHGFAVSPHIGGQANKGHGLVDLDYAITDLGTGEVRPFLRLARGTLHLSAAAEDALTAYDQHCRALYDAMLDANQPELRAMLGAGA